MTTRTLVAGVVFAVGMVCGGPAGATEGVEIVPDVIYGHKHGLALTFDVFKPKQANGAGVLFMVSGGWFSQWTPPEQLEPRFLPLLDKGFTVFAVRHGSSPKYLIPEIVEDVRRSVRFVRYNAAKFGVDPERLGVTGASAGGHLSLILGTTADNGNPKASDPILRVSDRVAAVVAYFPPTDIRPWVTTPESSYYKNYPALRFDVSKAADYSPLLQVTSDAAPTLLVHGDQDKLVPLEHSQNILAEFRKQHVAADLVVIPGAAHAFHGADGRRASDALVNWFEQHLAAPKGK